MKTTIQEAWNILCDLTLSPLIEKVSILEAVGRVAAMDVRAAHESPPFDQSRYDGFAVGEANDKYSSSFKISQENAITAGDPKAYRVAKGRAIPIMTGAPIPEGACMVVPQEACDVQGNTIVIRHLPDKERMILKKGADFIKGELLLKNGEPITPIHVAFLALDGRRTVEAYRRPTLSVLSFGDELMPFTSKDLGESKIRNSHVPLIHALLSPFGTVVREKRVADDQERIEKALRKEADADTQIIVTTGGLGKGIKDLTQKALHAIRAFPLFEGINAVPIGTFSCYLYKNKVVFSMPGGMIGVLLLTKLYLLPFVKKLQKMPYPREVGPFQAMRVLPQKIPFIPSKRPSGKQPVRFAKAKSWREGKHHWVSPLEESALRTMNAFMVLNLIKPTNRDEVPVFQLWEEIP